MYNSTILDNGIRIVTEAVPYVRTISIGFWIKVGSRMEELENNGVSHIIEHMLFKGTEKRSARRIAEEIDNIGGQLNAFTSKEYTCYYSRCLDTHKELALDVLVDILRNSLISTTDLEKEKGVVLEEIRMYEDSPDELSHDLIFQALWGEHQLGWNTLGRRDTVVKLSREGLVEYMNKWYRPNNIVVAAVGNFEHEWIVRQIESIFGDMEGHAETKSLPVPLVEKDTVIKKRDTEQIHLCLGVPGFSRVDPQRYAVSVLDVLLGGSMSSRLFQELREELGLVYSTYSYNTCYSDTGLFGIYAGMSPKNTRQVVDVMLKHFSMMRAGDISEDEIWRVKEQLKGGLVINLESMSNRMSRLAKQALFHHRLLTPDELIARIDAVTRDDVVAVAYSLLNPANIAVSAVGPVDDRLGHELIELSGRRYAHRGA